MFFGLEINAFRSKISVNFHNFLIDQSICGKTFFGESMFHEVSDASKLALWALAERLKAWNFDLIDCQMNTPHLASLGAVEIPRSQFLKEVRESVAKEHTPDDWSLPETGS